MKHAKKVWAFFYYLADLPVLDIIVRKTLHAADRKSWKGLEAFLLKEDPDAIVSTHFFLTSVAKDIKRNDKLRAKLFLMVSGFGMHNVWFSKYIDHFFVSTEDVKADLVKRGVDSARVSITGMPASAQFYKEYDRAALRKEFALDPGRKTVLLMLGGYGVAPMVPVLDALKACKSRIQVLVVCGHNNIEYGRIDALNGKGEWGFPVRPFGFTDRMAELMSVSDMIVSKTGTSSVTQAITMRLPMVLFSHVHGQETPTLDMLVQKGAGVYAGSEKEIAARIDEIFLDEKKYGTMREAVSELRRPEAADQMAKIILNELRGGAEAE
jgi:processive 1,2-diacylglycerol beta-glucosyltransferase